MGRGLIAGSNRPIVHLIRQYRSRLWESTRKGLALSCCCDFRVGSMNAKLSVALTGVGLSPRGCACTIYVNVTD